MYTAPFASNSSSSKALNPTIQGHRKRPSDCLNDLDALHLSSVTPVNGSTSQGTDAGQVSKKMKDTSDGAKLPQVTPLAAKSAQHLQLSAKEVEELKATAQKFGLLPHQEEVLTKILKKDNNGEGLILAHQAGLGKTRTSLSFLFHLASTEKMKAGDHALILAPNNDILKQWQKEHATLSGMSGDNSLSLLSYTGADRNKKLEKAVAADKKAGKKDFSFAEFDITDEVIKSHDNRLLSEEKIDTISVYVIESVERDKKGEIIYCTGEIRYRNYKEVYQEIGSSGGITEIDEYQQKVIPRIGIGYHLYMDDHFLVDFSSYIGLTFDKRFQIGFSEPVKNSGLHFGIGIKFAYAF